MVLVDNTKVYKSPFPKKNTWTDSPWKPLNWKCTHTKWR